MTLLNMGWGYYKGCYKKIEKDLLSLYINKGNEKRLIEHITKINQTIMASTSRSNAGTRLFDLDDQEMSIESISFGVLPPGLLMGIGYDHEAGIEGEFKLGFSFDHTTGLPILPGSSVKGTLRSSFPFKKEEEKNRELTSYKAEYIRYKIQNLEDFDGKGWLEKEQEAGIYKLGEALFEGIPFNRKTEEERLGIYERVIFFDAYIHKTVRTKPGETQLFYDDYLAPHSDNFFGEPVPLRFLKINPRTRILFRFKIPAQSSLGLPAPCVLKLFESILLDTGVGAKTREGYGQLKKPERK